MSTQASRAVAQLTAEIDALIAQKDRLRDRKGSKPRSGSDRAARWLELSERIYLLTKERELIEAVPIAAPLAVMPGEKGAAIAQANIGLRAVGMPTYTDLLAALAEAQQWAQQGNHEACCAAIARVKISF